MFLTDPTLDSLSQEAIKRSKDLMEESEKLRNRYSYR